MSTGMLTLNVEGKCNGQCTCQGAKNIHGLEVKKVAIPTLTNFTKYTHSVPNGRTFKLNKALAGSGGWIGTKGDPIPKVAEVSVYYWDGNDAKPILVGITRSGNNKPTFYGKNGIDIKLSWLTGLVEYMDEQQALDQQNCHNNNAVVFNIESSESGTLTKDDKVTCVNTARRIDSTASSPPPPGSDYTVTSFRITYINGGYGQETRISRVTLNNKPTNIPPSDAIEEIKLYSYLGSGQVPIMIEFAGVNGGNSTFYVSKDQNYTIWESIGNNNFYDKGDHTPKAALSEKLDEVLCSRDNNITLDLSHNISTRGGRYCCSYHNTNKVTVTSHRVDFNGSKITYYKHSLSKGSVAGIKYYLSKDNDKKNRMKISGPSFPMDGVNTVYVFYCNHNPTLIYVDSDSIAANKWYRKQSKDGDGKPWKMTFGPLKGVKPKDINDCDKWNKLTEVLRKHGCGDFGTCKEAKKPEKQYELLGRSDSYQVSGSHTANNSGYELDEESDPEGAAGEDGAKGDLGETASEGPPQAKGDDAIQLEDAAISLPSGKSGPPTALAAAAAYYGLYGSVAAGLHAADKLIKLANGVIESVISASKAREFPEEAKGGPGGQIHTVQKPHADLSDREQTTGHDSTVDFQQHDLHGQTADNEGTPGIYDKQEASAKPNLKDSDHPDTADEPPAPPPSTTPQASALVVETAATATGLGVIFGSSSGTLTGAGATFFGG